MIRRELLSRKELAQRVRSERGERSLSAQEVIGRTYDLSMVLSARELPRSEQEHFLVQTLYKLEGNLEPKKFLQALGQAIGEWECLRKDSIRIGSALWSVLLRDRDTLPEVMFQDLSSMDGEELEQTLEKILEADMRQEFDILGGMPLRFSAFRTGEREFAVLVTAAGSILREFDPRWIFCEALGRGHLFMENPRAPRKAPVPPGSLPPMPALPYAKVPRDNSYRQRAYRVQLPPEIVRLLQAKAGGDLYLLMAILHTAWGLFLLDTNDGGEVCYLLLLPGGDSSEGASFHLMPVCLQRESARSIEKTVRQLAEAGRSSAYEEFLPAEGFDHFLSFYDFFGSREEYTRTKARPEGNPVSRNVRDAQQMALSIYFHRKGDGSISLSFLYDENRFKPYGIELTAKRYVQILQYTLTEWKHSLSSLSEHTLEEPSPVMYREEAVKDRLYGMFSRIKVFHDVPREAFQQIMECSRVAECLSGDRIPQKDLEENCIFVIEGRVSRTLNAGNGWYGFLDIRGKRSWLNETILLPSRRAKLSAEILSEEAILIYIPLAEMNRLMNDEPIVQRQMLLYTLEELEKHHCLWVQM